MDDLISRRAAIDAMSESLKRVFPEHRQIAEKCLKALPSAQPEPQWISVNENQPDKYGWYLCSLKDGRVNTLYWHNRKGWIDNVRMHMFELYDIRSKLTGNEVKPENESVYWNDWVKAWMPLPKPYRAERRTDDANDIT